MPVLPAQPGEIAGRPQGIEAERGRLPGRVRRRGTRRVQVLDLVHELLVAGVDVEDVDEPAVQPFCQVDEVDQVDAVRRAGEVGVVVEPVQMEEVAEDASRRPPQGDGPRERRSRAQAAGLPVGHGGARLAVRGKVRADELRGNGAQRLISVDGNLPRRLRGRRDRR